MGRKSFQAIICILLLAAGCKKDDTAPSLPPVTSGRKAFVVCEGSLGYGNSALGLYLPEKDSSYDDVYKAANGQSLGDIFQSMTRIGDHYLLCINNSDKIIRIRRDNWLVDGTMTIAKPRYILAVNDTKAYVSSIFSKKLFVINPQTMQLTGTLNMPFENAEGMMQYGTTAFICSWDTANNKLYQVNTATDAVTAGPALAGFAPQDILMDKEQKVWVLAGNVPKKKSATLTRIDPSTGNILSSYSFASGADPEKPVFNATKDTLYFIEVDYNGGTANNGIYRMGIHDASLPSQPFIAAQSFQYFWALGIQPATGYIYVGDPKGFTQKGLVNIYKQDGTLLKSFRTGIGPGHFFFDE